MTSINIDKVKDIIVVSVSGHAGYSAENDIVCASLSTITQSLLATLKAYADDKKVIIRNEQIKEDIGCCLFSFTPVSYPEIEAMLDMAIMGYMMLEQAYPKNVSLTVDMGEK